MATKRTTGKRAAPMSGAAQKNKLFRQQMAAVIAFAVGLLLTFLALVGGGLYGVWLLATRRAGRKSHFAFGPFLAGGIGVALLWGEGLISGYLSLFGLA